MKFEPCDEIGPYRIVRVLGQGGMGTVYEVEHVKSGVRFALKSFSLDHGNVELLRKRFLAEGKVLERLLSDDPSGRVCQRVEKRRPRRFRKGFGLSLLGVAFVCAVLLAWQRMLCLADADESASPELIVLTIDATNRFDFCVCPPGTNAYRTLSAAVTHPYWLAATPVTRRQWFAVRGEPLMAWEGGEDAPMTYVSRDDVTDFCTRLTARFSAKLPKGYEIRLPTLAEWRLAYAQGKTVPTHFAGREDMRRYYMGLNRPLPLVTNIWPAFPPHVINPGKDNWARDASIPFVRQAHSHPPILARFSTCVGVWPFARRPSTMF